MDPLEAKALSLLGQGDDLDSIYSQAASQYKVPEKLLRALVQQESEGKVGVKSSAGAEGPAQLMPSTSQTGQVSPWNYAEAIPYAAKLLSDSYKANPDWNNALKTYFGGPDQSKWGPKTAQYPLDVMGQFAKLGGKPEDLGTNPQRLTLTVKPQASTSADPLMDKALKLMALDPEGQAQAPSPSPSPSPSQIPTNVSPPPILPQTPSKPPTPLLAGGSASPWDWSDSFLNGLTLGYLPEVKAGSRALATGAENLLSGQGLGPSLASVGQNYTPRLTAEQAEAKNYKTNNPLANMTGELAGTFLPLTGGINTAGNIARAGIGMVERAGLPNVAQGLGTLGDIIGGSYGATTPGLAGVAGQLGSRATQGAVQGGLMSGALSHMGPDSVGDQMASGAKVGFLANPLLGAVASPVERLLNTKITPENAKILGSPEAVAVGLRPGQVAQGSMAKTVDKVLASGANTEQAQKFNDNLAQILGIPGETFTKQSLQSAKQGAWQRVAQAGQQVGQFKLNLPNGNFANSFEALDDLRTRIMSSNFIDDPTFKPVLRMLNRLETDFLTGINGKEFVTMTKSDGNLGSIINSKSSEAAAFGREARDILTNAMEATAHSIGKPELVNQIKEGRTTYRALSSLDPLLDRPKNQSGLLNPPEVSKALNETFSTPNQFTAAGDPGKFMPQLTPQGDPTKALSMFDFRNYTHHIPQLLGGLLGFGGGHAGGLGSLGSLALAGGGVGAGHMIGAGAEKLLSSPAYRTRMSKFNLGQALPYSVQTQLGLAPVEDIYHRGTQ